MKNRKKLGLILTLVIILIILFIVGVIIAINSNEKTKSEIKVTTTTKKENTKLSSGTINTSIDGKNITYNAAYIVDGIDAYIGSGTYESNNQDETVFLVINGGSLTIDGNVKINDNGSDSSGDGDNYNFYGTNSAIVVVGNNSSANINGAVITTNAGGANAVFATNEGNINIKNSTINTYKNSSRGLDATYNGKITADSVNISTKGASCASLATDRGEGTVNAKNMTLKTEGKGSPIIYSTGNITLEDSTGISTGSQLVVVEGKNSATVKNSNLKTNGVGNRNDVDNCAIMIYQSMSGDANEGVGSFISDGSTLTIMKDSSKYSSAPFFFITNTKATINMTNTKINYGSNELVSIKSTSEWGTSGKNGGTVNMTLTKQTLNGNIYADELSSVSVNLTNNSKLTGNNTGTVEITNN